MPSSPQQADHGVPADAEIDREYQRTNPDRVGVPRRRGWKEELSSSPSPCRAVSWYAVRIIRRATNITAPNTTFKFLNYREDVIDGVLCRWDYKQPYHRAQFRIENLLCYCRHCDFIIGRPNHHEQRCPSCSRRAVRSDNSPFYTNNILREEIAGYQRREDAMPFENFIRLEIDRRVRTEEWSKPVKAEGT